MALNDAQERDIWSRLGTLETRTAQILERIEPIAAEVGKTRERMHGISERMFALDTQVKVMQAERRGALAVVGVIASIVAVVLSRAVDAIWRRIG